MPTLGLQMMSSLVPTFLIVPMLLIIPGLLICLILYLLVRWQDSKNTSPDPQIGYKFGLNIFKFLAFYLMLISIITIFFIALNSSVGDGRFSEKSLHYFFAMMAPGYIIYYHAKYNLSKTNQESHPQVNRLFSSLNWFLTGLITIYILVSFSSLLFAPHFIAIKWAANLSQLFVILPAFIVFNKQTKEYNSLSSPKYSKEPANKLD